MLVDGARRGIGAVAQVRADTEARIRAAGFESVMRERFSSMFSDASDTGMRDRIIERALKLDRQAGVELVADMLAWDAGEMEDALDHVRVPVLMIQSTDINLKPLRPAQRTPCFPALSE